MCMQMQRVTTYLKSFPGNYCHEEWLTCCRAYVHEMLESPPDGVMLVARLVPEGKLTVSSPRLCHALVCGVMYFCIFFIASW